jgi:hypothetical protein
MAQNIEKMAQNPSNSAENTQNIEQFKEQNSKAVSQPSIILAGGIEQIGYTRLIPKDVEKYLLMHPVIPRGIDIRSNRITGRGYRVLPKKENDAKAQEAADYVNRLLQESGGEILLNGWVKDTYAFGNGYLTLLPDSTTGEISFISREHPVFFRIARYKSEQAKNSENTEPGLSDFTTEYGDMKIDPVTKKPVAYTQVVYDGEGKMVTPIGKELGKGQVAHLVLDTWGDEAEGIGLVQYVYTSLKYLMNIEEAGAEAIYRSGFSQKKVTTDIMNEKDLKKLARNLKELNSSDSIILPKGTDVNNLVPGTTEFKTVHDIFLTLVCIRLGIPKPILTLDGTDINKATMRELMRDMIYDIHADEIKLKRTLEEQVFLPACESKFGEGFDLVPEFFFNDFSEGKEERAEVLNTMSDYIKKTIDSYKVLMDTGQKTAAISLLKFMFSTIPVEDLIGQNSKIDDIDFKVEDNPEPPMPKPNPFNTKPPLPPEEALKTPVNNKEMPPN